MPDLLTKLGLAVLLHHDDLTALVRSAPHRYKIFQIPKRTPGQFRTIAQPAREVKALQYWVLENVLSLFPVHQAATAYGKGQSIAGNARPHVRGRFLLKLDFQDFFPSLKADDFRLFLKRHQPDFNDMTVDALCRILFWRPKGTRDLLLSIGAPTSPMLSNILMRDFDRRVSALCAVHDVAYTRYADDLTFSATRSEQLRLVEEAVIDLSARMTSPKLKINRDKTVRVSRRDARRVTGLVLTNDRKISIGRDAKRQIRAAMHHFATNKLDTDQILKLRGMLAYINSVEPNFLRRLRKKYGSDTVKRCIEWSTGTADS